MWLVELLILDIDECREHPGICSYKCQNTDGDFDKYQIKCVWHVSGITFIRYAQKSKYLKAKLLCLISKAECCVFTWNVIILLYEHPFTIYCDTHRWPDLNVIDVWLPDSP
jgi:hypothetical protein